jgi:two-component system, NarL family, nitrate/nitrite response regulator NarL
MMASSLNFEQDILSDRQLQVLKGLSDGKTQQEIARELGLSLVRVEQIVRSIREKFDADNLVQVGIQAVSQGIVRAK